MSKGLDYFLFEGFEDASSNDETGNDNTAEDTENNNASSVDDSGNDTTASVDASGNDTTASVDASGNDTTASVDASGNDTTASVDASGNDTSTTETKDGTLSIILTYENLYLLFWFVAFYFIVYSILAFLFTRDSLGYVYDVIILITISLMAGAYWFFQSDEKTKDDVEGVADRFLKFFEDKYNAVYITGAIVILYLVVFLFGLQSEPGSKPRVIVGLETLLFILLVLVLFCLGFKEFMEVSLPEEFRKHLGITEGAGSGNGSESGSGSGTVVSQIQENRIARQNTREEKEVFNVGGNHYSYTDAEAICKSFDSELADYDQIETSYNNGGEWCNYGWSKNQMALFPTQKNTWNKLQDNDKTKNNCGRPGINGGYMANPALRFGVNCYGKKPDKRDIDYTPVEETMPTNPEDIKTNAAITYWKNNQDKLKLNYFNKDKWSRI